MNLLSIADLKKKDITLLIKQAEKIKASPMKYQTKLKNKTLLMFFEQPSLRTRISFEAGMTQLGGHGIYYHIGESTIGKKETFKDFGNVVSHYCDAIMMRLNNHEDLIKVASAALPPVINGMTMMEHPCQALSDLMTIHEKFGTFDLRLAYLGDGNNNITHSLMFASAIMGMNIAVASPKGYQPDRKILKKAQDMSNGTSILVTPDPEEAARNADIVYTDSWMSYHVPEEQKEERVKALIPYQVNQKIMDMTKKHSIFMHCLPAKRGHEVSEDVMDGEKSIVYEQAGNRLHMQKAILLKLVK